MKIVTSLLVSVLAIVGTSACGGAGATDPAPIASQGGSGAPEVGGAPTSAELRAIVEASTISLPTSRGDCAGAATLKAMIAQDIQLESQDGYTPTVDGTCEAKGDGWHCSLAVAGRPVVCPPDAEDCEGGGREHVIELDLDHERRIIEDGIICYAPG